MPNVKNSKVPFTTKPSPSRPHFQKQYIAHLNWRRPTEQHPARCNSVSSQRRNLLPARNRPHLHQVVRRSLQKQYVAHQDWRRPTEQPECPAWQATQPPSRQTQTPTKLSPLPETICCSSGLKATDQTPYVCLASDATAFITRLFIRAYVINMFASASSCLLISLLPQQDQQVAQPSPWPTPTQGKQRKPIKIMPLPPELKRKRN